MRIFGRSLPIGSFPQKLASIILIGFTIIKLCKNPLRVLKAYFKRKGLDYIQLRNGYKIFLSSSKHDISTFVVIFCKREYGDIRNKQTVMDIGANIGMFSMYAICQGAQKVYAFEPNKESFATIQKTIAANNLQHRFEVFNLAVSGISGEKIFIPKQSSPGNISLANVAHAADRYDAIDTISPEDFIQQNGLTKIDLLKVDCEGAEYDLLPALSSQTVKNIEEIKLEFHGSEEPLRDWFKKHGFKLTNYWRSTEEKDLGYLWAIH